MLRHLYDIRRRCCRFYRARLQYAAASMPLYMTPPLIAMARSVIAAFACHAACRFRRHAATMLTMPAPLPLTPLRHYALLLPLMPLRHDAMPAIFCRLLPPLYAAYAAMLRHGD